jgi:hypothetical protein
MGRFPHLSPEDAEIFKKFLKLHGEKVEGIWADVRVGKGQSAPDDVSESTKRLAILNSQKRIDIVLKWKAHNILWITEVRIRSGPGSLGSALTTWFLFKEEDPRPAIPAIITDIAAPDMKGAYKNFKVELIETG